MSLITYQSLNYTCTSSVTPWAPKSIVAIILTCLSAFLTDSKQQCQFTFCSEMK
jgi:hypothetical protein